ncbi:MAG: hypothetical protein MJZ18_01700 [Bacteroidales bacterium]|nr:hypothetical protein [Bacteroidales bacterium]
MDEKLRATIEKIRILSIQNKEFDAELRKMYGGQQTSSAVGVFMPSETMDDVKAIRAALEIRANVSVSYEFIIECRLRDQLIVDNLRMENSSLDLQKNEKERFYIFCVNAFYQLENILNYYYFKTFPRIESLLDEIEYYTSEETYKFVRTKKERNVADIQVVHKINAFCNRFFPHDTINYTLNSLRQVRNEGEHRCMVIQDGKDENNYLYKFFNLNTFNSIRIVLIKVVTTVKENIGRPEISVTNIVEAMIVNMLPGGCFVSVNGKIKQLPANLFSMVKGKKNGDMIELVLRHGKIEGVEM